MSASVLAQRRGLRIISDGTAARTYLVDMLGERVKLGNSFLTKIVFDPIEPNGLITAHITVENVEIDLAVLPDEQADDPEKTA